MDKVINIVNATTCQLDPCPACLVKASRTTTSSDKFSLQEGTFLKPFKEALVCPFLKKKSQSHLPGQFSSRLPALSHSSPSHLIQIIAMHFMWGYMEASTGTKCGSTRSLWRSIEWPILHHCFTNCIGCWSASRCSSTCWLFPLKPYHGIGPDYLMNDLVLVRQPCPTCASRGGLLRTPSVKELQRRSRRRVFFAVALAFWNILPPGARFLPTLLSCASCSSSTFLISYYCTFIVYLCCLFLCYCYVYIFNLFFLFIVVSPE